MKYITVLTGSIFLKDSGSAVDSKKIQTLFSDRVINFEADDNEDFLLKAAARLKHREVIHPFYCLEIFNTAGEIIFCFFGSQLDCLKMQKHFGLGGIIETSLTTATRKDYFFSNHLKVEGILKKLDSAFVKRFLIPLGPIQEVSIPFLPEKLKAKNAEEMEKIIDSGASPCAKVDLELIAQDYENVPAFKKVFDSIKNLQETYEEIRTYKKECEEYVRQSDLKTLDELHNIEFNFHSMNAAQGYNFAKSLNALRIKRRNAKDKLEIIEALEDAFLSIDLKKLGDLKINLDNRKYRTRINKGVFDTEKELNTPEKL